MLLGLEVLEILICMLRNSYRMIPVDLDFLAAEEETVMMLVQRNIIFLEVVRHSVRRKILVL